LGRALLSERPDQGTPQAQPCSVHRVTVRIVCSSA
jgi:hypothetical protein